MKNDLRFTTAGDYMDDVTGTETWQTKANEKNKVPRYMSPSEINSMRLDKLEQSLLRGMVEQRKRIDTLEDMVKNLSKRLSSEGL